MAASASAVGTAIGAPAVLARPGSSLAERHETGCDVAVEALLDANVYRGSPDSQMKWDSYKRDPAYGKFAEGVDHGAAYLSCKWRVRINGARYSFERASHGGPDRGDLRADLCKDAKEADATADDVVRSTDACKDLHRSEYYGTVFKPIDDAPAPSGSASR